MQERPHPIWWVAHIFLCIISGLVVYVLYKDKNPAAARRHLIGSIIIGILGIILGVVIGILGILVGSDDGIMPI